MLIILGKGKWKTNSRSIWGLQLNLEENVIQDYSWDSVVVLLGLLRWLIVDKVKR